MDEVAQTEGRTVLFVSHNMSAIQSLCQKTILLENGKIKKTGNTDEVVAFYLGHNPLTQEGTALSKRKDRKGKGNVKLVSFYVESNGKKVEVLETGGHYTFCFGYETVDGKPVKNLHIGSQISADDGTPLALNWGRMTNQDTNTAPPKGTIMCEIKQKFPLNPGLYHLSANLFSGDIVEDYIKNLGIFEVKSGDFYNTNKPIERGNLHFTLEQDWSIKENKI